MESKEKFQPLNDFHLSQVISQNSAAILAPILGKLNNHWREMNHG